MADTRVNLCGVALDNPLIAASGTFGFGAEFRPFYDINVLGALSLKGATREPRFGNPAPRVAECPSGMLNAIGLQNPGVERVAAEELPALRAYYRKPILANVGGFSLEEYAYVAEKLDPLVDILEVNISCPNVHAGGVNFSSTAKGAEAVTRAVKRVAGKPVFVKLSPNVTDIAEIARACAGAGADGLCLINTLLGLRIDLKRRRPLLGNIFGGLSGPAVLPVALRMVYQVYEAVKLPIIGAGGVSRAEDVLEMMLAGATAVQVGAANLVDPYACPKIVAALPETMEKFGVSRLNDIIGGAH